MEHNLDFGVVHAWVSAVRVACYWTTTTTHNEEELAISAEVGPSSFVGLGGYLNGEEGEVLAKLLAPPLGRLLTELEHGYIHSY